MKCNLCAETKIDVEMVERTGKTGKFLGCSRYPACKNVKRIAGQSTSRPQSKSKFVNRDEYGEIEGMETDMLQYADVPFKEIRANYRALNKSDGQRVIATTMFLKPNGSYDVIFWVKRRKQDDN
jgi:ssDNA-binding Zn-finger/Zn-ribbon topoisomerase 1